MINFFKKDFASVRFAVKLLTNDKAPDWAIVIWYIVILPFGLALAPFAKLATWLMIKKMMRDLEKYQE